MLKGQFKKISTATLIPLYVIPCHILSTEKIVKTLTLHYKLLLRHAAIQTLQKYTCIINVQYSTVSIVKFKNVTRPDAEFMNVQIH
jgi:hypothetical protein